MLSTIRNYRELIYFLVHKELRVKYRNSFFGFFWSLLEPLGMMVIYTIVFSIIIGGRFEVDNYPLFVLSGLIPWMFVANTLNKGAKSLTKNSSLIKKVYFPRQIFPISAMLANLVNFIPALGLVIVLALVTQGGEMPYSHLLVLPGIIALHALIVLSITIVLSVLNVYYKDVEIILSVVLRGWMYLSPIIYPLHIIPDQYIDWYLLNPMAVVISLYRWTFFADTVIPLKYIVYVSVLAILGCLAAWALFNRLSRRVGEII